MISLHAIEAIFVSKLVSGGVSFYLYRRRQAKHAVELGAIIAEQLAAHNDHVQQHPVPYHDDQHALAVIGRVEVALRARGRKPPKDLAAQVQAVLAEAGR